MEELNIDACSICQLKCVRCPATEMDYKSTIGQGYLRFEKFKRLIDANPQLQRVELENIGELFLNPELLLIIEYAHSKNVQIGCSVGANLNHATDEMLEGLVKYGFHNLTCSIDGASPETYAIYRVGGDFNRVMQNISKINIFKKKYNSELPKLKWQFIVFGHNEHEIPTAKKLATDLGMEFIPKMSWDSEYSPIKDRDFVLRETGWSFLTRGEYEEVTGKCYLRSTCYSLWHSPRINWDGRVLGCCWNTWSDFGGNAFEQGYMTAVNSDVMQRAKQLLMGQIGPADDIPCTICELYAKLAQTGEFLTSQEIYAQQSRWYLFARNLYRVSGLKRLDINVKLRNLVFRVRRFLKRA